MVGEVGRARSRPRGVGWISGALLCFGCGYNVIPTALSPALGFSGQLATEEPPRTSVGASSQLTVHWSGPLAPATGLLAGLEQEGAVMLQQRPFDRYRVGLLVGYGREPLRHRPWLGLQGVLAGGVGRFPFRSEAVLAGEVGTGSALYESRFGFYVGGRLLTPMRWRKRRPLWEAENVIDGIPMIVPWSGLTVLLPSRGDTGPRLAVEYGLALRFTLWSAVAP